MEYQSILAQIYEGLAPFTQGAVTIDEDTELTGQLELDSLQVMNLLLSIEDCFDISIPVSILPDVKTVRDLALQVEKLTARA